VNETFLGPGASSPILTLSKSFDDRQRFGPRLRVSVPFGSDSEKVSAAGVVVVAAAVAVGWNRPPSVGGEPESGNLVSMVDLKVCGELVII
jgi:hypothetical protein